MNDILVPIIVALLAGGTIAAAVTAYAARRKTKAEANTTEAKGAQVVVNAAEVLVGMSRRDVERLDKANQELRETLENVDKRLQACEELKETIEHELKLVQRAAEDDHLGREGKIDRREQ